MKLRNIFRQSTSAKEKFQALFNRIEAHHDSAQALYPQIEDLKRFVEAEKASKELERVSKNTVDSIKSFSLKEAAGEIICHINEKKIAEAKELLGPSGTYLRVSEQTVGLIRRLNAAAMERGFAGRVM